MANETATKQSFSAQVDLWSQVIERSASDLKWSTLLSEFIDNALDARASIFQLAVIQGKFVRVSDNGIGINPVHALVHFGGHYEHKKSKEGLMPLKPSGFYGVGFKDAALRLGGPHSTINVRTTRIIDGQRKTFSGFIHWEKLKTSTCCMQGRDVESEAPTGTEIEISPLQMKFPEGKSREQLLEDLGYLYSPALKAGRVIQVTAGGKTHTVKRWELPEFEEKVDVKLNIEGGSARVFAGIVKDGHANPRKGITYCYGYRVVKPNSRFGCGEYAADRICGFVEVDENWRRTKNKTDLVNADALYEEVERVLTPLLKKAEQRAKVLAFDGVVNDVESMLQSALFGSPEEKAIRDKGDKHGSVEPKNTGRKHNGAKSRQDGATFGARRAISTIKLKLEPGWKEGEPIGTYNANNKAAFVTLFQDHPMVALASSARNNLSLFALAMSVVSVAWSDAVGNQTSWLSPGDVLRRLGAFTSKPGTLDGQRLDAAAE